MAFYNGDLLPQEAYKMLQAGPFNLLIDVRTIFEIRFIGAPLLGFKGQYIAIEWRRLDDMSLNQTFLQEVQELLAAQNNKIETISMLCRTGGRSYEAANFCAEYIKDVKFYNISYGFEGELDKRNHRGNINGWKADKLPWRQD